MSHPVAQTSLSQLQAGVRDELLDWIVEFDQQWHDGLIASYSGTLSEELRDWRVLALLELVRVDLAKQWRQGSHRLLESYLDQFPELGTSDTVSPELVVAEVEARKAAQQPMSGRELKQRFPLQADAVRDMVQVNSGIGRSQTGERLASTIARRDTASLGPGQTRFPAPSGGGVPAVGQTFGPGARYRIVKRLGRGGMGAVYLATDSALDGRKVAIKVPNFSAANAPELMERFRREAALLATTEHPNLGRVYDIAESDGVTFLVMEFIPGIDLGEYLKSDRLLKVEKCVWIARKIAAALQTAHAKGVVHRDLKPQNIMLGRDGQPRLIDFGLAVNVSGNQTRATQDGTTMGTPEYMPLEQITGDLSKIGPRSDVYSLGIVLYEMLTRTVPFTGDSPLAVGVKLYQATAVSPLVHNPELDPRLAEIVLKAIAKEPDDRYESMEEFADVLAEYAKSSKEPAPLTVFAAASQTSSIADAAGVATVAPAETVAPIGFPPLDTSASATLHRPHRSRALSTGTVIAVAAVILMAAIVITITSRNGQSTTVNVAEGTRINLKVDEGAEVSIANGAASATDSTTDNTKPALPQIVPATPPEPESQAANNVVPLMLNDDFLTDWEIAGPKVTNFQSRDGGLLVRNGGGPGWEDHLVSRRTDFENFVLRYEVRLSDPGHPSLVMFRVDPSPATFGGLRGYEFQLRADSDPPDAPRPDSVQLAISNRVRAGLVLNRMTEPSFKIGHWIAVEIRVDRQTINVSCDGQTVLAHTDKAPTFRSGPIALRFLSGNTIEYRNLTVEELPPTPGEPGSRTRWVHQALEGNQWNERWGVFAQADGESWSYTGTTHPRMFRETYSETGRTDDYVQLEKSDGGRTVIRLFVDRAERGPDEDQLKVVWQGRWADSGFDETQGNP